VSPIKKIGFEVRYVAASIVSLGISRNDMHSPIKTLFVVTSYPANLQDWRGLFIRHLADALARRADLTVSLLAPPGESHARITSTTTASEAAWLNDLMQKGGIAHALHQGGLAAIITPMRLLYLLRTNYRRQQDVDIYHINWLQNALPLPADGKPLLVSVLGTDMQLINKAWMRFLLRRVFRQHPTRICPNAQWMVEPLNAAFGDVAKIAFVPFGIDPAWYAIARHIPLEQPAKWLVVSRLTKAKIGALFEWCAPLFDGHSRELHLFGPMQENIPLPSWVHYHGATNPDDLGRNWFPIAQGLITLSQHAEGRPQVMLEAMAAGLPIIASRLPAHENIVFQPTTGWLCDDAADVRLGVHYFEQADTNLQAGLAARDWVKQEVGTWDDCAARYVSLYDALRSEFSHV
jgi:glycosyltransferase involved in cell wall biosynthesis